MNELAGGKRATGLGIIMMILGFLVMMAPAFMGMSILWFVGILVVMAGLIRMLWAFRAETLGGGLFVFALGGLTLVAGLVLLGNPMLATG